MKGSFLALEEYFDAGALQFPAELRATVDAGKLRTFAERWYRDPRPWARQQIHAYLDQPLNCPGHEPLVKKLFKLAEAAGDDATMARFLVALDRCVRRSEWGGARNTTLKRGGAFDPKKRLFSVHTRNYLRRRAWRYFRHLGFRDPKRYLAAVLEALPLYRDEDCDSGIHFLDNWGLIHILFRGSPILGRSAHAWNLGDDMVLRDLKPAPAFAKVWETAGDAVLSLLISARARPVRRTALSMVKAQPGLIAKLPVERLMALFGHPDEEVQALGAELLRTAAGLESAPLELWERLLEVKSLFLLEAVCEVMQKVVAPDRLSTEELFRFACAPLGPIARMGLGWLKSRSLPPAQLVGLAQLRAESVAADAVAFAREKMSAAPDFDPEWILAFLDSPIRAAREAAWPWFAEEKRTRQRIDLWGKLVETPYDDVRIAVVLHLERFAATDMAMHVLLARAPLETIWATVLLNVQRGSRAKRMAASQIAQVIERQPERADQLLPLLRVAARSIRAPEFRAGLAALVRVATRRPEVAAAVASHFPELKL